MSHTPTPWAIAGNSLNAHGRITGSYFAKCDNGIVGQTFSNCLAGDDECQANAEFIVRAVNAHDDLVSSMTKFLDMYIGMVKSGDCGFWNAEIEPEVIACRAALDKAGAA